MFLRKHYMDEDECLNEKLCVICMEQTTEPILFHCNCKALTHQSCIQKWRNVRSEHYDSMKCEVCNTDYDYTVVAKTSPLQKIIFALCCTSFLNIGTIFFYDTNSLILVLVMAIITLLVLAFFKNLQYSILPMFLLGVSVFIKNYPGQIVLYTLVSIQSYVCGILLIGIGMLVSVFTFCKKRNVQRREFIDQTRNRQLSTPVAVDLFTSMH